MKIYWNYGKKIDDLLYIDRIIFIKIHIPVQEPAWSHVICQPYTPGMPRGLGLAIQRELGSA